MSANNIIEITKSSIEEDIDNLYYEQSQKYILKRRFMLGYGADISKMKILKRLYRISKYCNYYTNVDKNLVLQKIKKLTY